MGCGTPCSAASFPECLRCLTDSSGFNQGVLLRRQVLAQSSPLSELRPQETSESQTTRYVDVFASWPSVSRDCPSARAPFLCCGRENQNLTVKISIGGVAHSARRWWGAWVVRASCFSWGGGSDLLLLEVYVLQTPVDDYPMAFAPFRGMLLAGVGHKLRLYALGKKRLLKKCEYKVSTRKRLLRSSLVEGNPSRRNTSPPPRRQHPAVYCCLRNE